MTEYKFETVLYEINGRLILRLPAEASAVLPSRGQALAEGTVNGIAVKMVLEPDGKGGHWFSPDDALIKRAGLSAGDKTQVEIAPSKDWPEPPVPEDLAGALKNNPEASAVWNDITPMARWDWIRWIRSTNNPDTRKHRIDVAFDKMHKGDRRPCCFNRNQCTVTEVSHRGVLLDEESY